MYKSHGQDTPSVAALETSFQCEPFARSTAGLASVHLAQRLCPQRTELTRHAARSALISAQSRVQLFARTLQQKSPLEETNAKEGPSI
jgi:hypothetical protein